MARPSTARLWASAPKGAQTGGLRLTRARGMARRGSAGPQSRGCAGDFAPFRGVLSFGDFSLDRQRKVTCRGSATHKLFFVIAEGDSTLLSTLGLEHRGL